MSTAEKTEGRQFWETPRRVSHEEAEASIKRFVDQHFRNGGETPTISIPANPQRDDDLLAMSPRGVFEALNHALLMIDRERIGRSASPSACIIVSVR